MLASAAAFRTLKKAAEFGLSTNGIGYDFSKIIDRKDWIVSQIAGPRMRTYFEDQNVHIIDGLARFISDHEVEVDGRRIMFDKALVATGSTPFVPPIDGLEDVGYITSNEAINLREVPESIIIIGGSAVGLEFATIYESFGSQVTIVEMAPTLAPKEDGEVSRSLQSYMNGRGINIFTNARINRAFLNDGVKSLSVETPAEETIIGAREIFVATGRRPLIDGLNLESIGVETGKKGITVNSYLQTTVENIYAAGDVIPGFQLAQSAAYEGDLVGANAFGEQKTAVSYRVIPRVTWSYPEIASVGITEEEARDKGIDYTVQKFAFAALARGFADGERLGFVKAIADTGSGELIGFHLIGHHADEVLHEGVVAMQGRVKVADLAQTIHCELTMAEGAGDAFIDLYDELEKKRRMAA